MPAQANLSVDSPCLISFCPVGSARCAVIPAQAGIQLTLCVNLCNKSKNYTSRLCRLDTARPRYDELPRLATLSQSTPSFCAGAQKRRGMSGIIIIHQLNSENKNAQTGIFIYTNFFVFHHYTLAHAPRVSMHDQHRARGNRAPLHQFAPGIYHP